MELACTPSNLRPLLAQFLVNLQGAFQAAQDAGLPIIQLPDEVDVTVTLLSETGINKFQQVNTTNRLGTEVQDQEMPEVVQTTSAVRATTAKTDGTTNETGKDTSVQDTSEVGNQTSTNNSNQSGTTNESSNSNTTQTHNTRDGQLVEQYS